MSACFYFDEDEGVVIATDNIDLTAVPSPEVAIKNFVTLAPEKTAGELFSAATELEMVRRFLRAREAVAPPARKIGDGSDKARVHGV